MAPTLSLLNITELGAEAEYLILLGDDCWGWVGKVVVDGEFHGFQVVQWTSTPRTLRLSTWTRVEALVRSDPGRIGIYYRWTECHDLYATEILATEAEQLRRARIDAAVAQAEQDKTRAELQAKHAAVRDRAAIRYHGTQTRAHGVGTVLGWCECDACDSLPRGDWRVLLDVSGYVVEHVRLSSITLVTDVSTE